MKWPVNIQETNKLRTAQRAMEWKMLKSKLQDKITMLRDQDKENKQR